MYFVLLEIGDMGVTSWLTNSALVYEPKCGGRRGKCGVSANCAQEPI
jgi:hypothetical protein